jgi:hypothetical protein
LAQKARWTRPDPGLAWYEGRTRGKRMRYTYSDHEEEEFNSEDPEPRRSGRALRSGPANEEYSEGSDAGTRANGRPTRNSRRHMESWIDGVDGEEDDDDEEGDVVEAVADDDASSNHSAEWQGEDEMEEQDDHEDAESVASESDLASLSPKSLVVKLSFSKDSVDKLRQMTLPSRQPAPQPQIKEEIHSNPQVVADHSFQPAEPVKMDVDPPKPSSPEAVSRPDFSKFLYTPPSNDMDIQPTTVVPHTTLPDLTHTKPNGLAMLPQHSPPSPHSQHSVKMPTPPHTSQPPSNGLPESISKD